MNTKQWSSKLEKMSSSIFAGDRGSQLRVQSSTRNSSAKFDRFYKDSRHSVVRIVSRER